jgi:GNAT superfamily N-acetyltransferase
MKQMRTVYKVDDKFNVYFAATFFIIELDTILYAFVELIRTSESFQRKGIAATFIGHMKEYLLQQLALTELLETAFIIVGQSKILKPHGFFAKQGFGPLPAFLQTLKLDGCDMASVEIIRLQAAPAANEE